MPLKWVERLDSFEQMGEDMKDMIDFLESGLSLHLYEDATDIKMIQYRNISNKTSDPTSMELAQRYVLWRTSFVKNLVPGKMSLKALLQ